MSGPPQPNPRPLGNVLVNHLGFCCQGRKEVVVRGAREGPFELQEMSLIRPAGMGAQEDFREVLGGRLRRVDSPLGDFCVGDFSERTAPGIYRVVLPDTGEHSYQFAIADGAYSWLPAMLLNYVHNWRSGPFENAWRGPTHLDDARRSDGGAPADVVAKSVRFVDAEYLEPRYLQPMIDLCSRYQLIDKDFPAAEVISPVALKPR